MTMIVSFSTLMLFNAMEKVIKSNKMSAIRTAAIYIANARMAEIEEYNLERSSFQIPSYTLLTDEDLIHDEFFGINGTVRFKVNTQINESSIDKGNVTVTVTWTVNNNSSYDIGNNYEKITKDIWIIPTDSTSSQQPQTQ
ncbi:MAG: hypothetical protein IJ862_03080 [Selenomonadaceae bacterium]|nr:hypothetical protein [Selenomonadaceae bacterium]